jgi:hypothetical protein
MNFLKDIHSVLSKGSNKRVDFDSDAFTDEELTTMTGINKVQFTDLVSRTGNLKLKLCSTRQAVGMLLFKLRTGLSLRYITL